MTDGYALGDIAAVVLAAGEGNRLRPLTLARPKPLCPVGGRPLVDLAIERAATVTSSIAINVHFGREQMLAHLADRPDLLASIEEPVALGTAGALGLLRPWIEGRPTLVLNADAWCRPDLPAFVGRWDGERVALLLADADEFHPGARVAAALMPWTEVSRLEAVPSGLYECSWRIEHAQGRLVTSGHAGPFVDCGSPRAYLRANLLAAAATPDAAEADGRRIVGTDSTITGFARDAVIGANCEVAGHIERTVVWDGCSVGASEHLVDAIRFDGGRTVLVR